MYEKFLQPLLHGDLERLIRILYSIVVAEVETEETSTMCPVSDEKSNVVKVSESDQRSV